jgi:hypothetical protein
VLRNFLHCVDVVFVWGGRKSLSSIIGADGMLSVNISGEEMRKRKREGLAGRLCQLTRPSHPSVSLFYKHTQLELLLLLPYFSISLILSSTSAYIYLALLSVTWLGNVVRHFRAPFRLPPSSRVSLSNESELSRGEGMRQLNSIKIRFQPSANVDYQRISNRFETFFYF